MKSTITLISLRTIAVVAGVSTFWGCGDSPAADADNGVSSDGVADAETDVAIVDCPEPGTAATQAEAFSFIPATWPAFCESPGLAIHAGTSFSVTADLDLDARDIDLPADTDCGETPPGCTTVVFRIMAAGDEGVAVDVLESVSVDGGDVRTAPVKIRLHAGTYRWRTEVNRAWVFNPAARATAILLPGCTTVPCPAGTARCPADLACYHTDTTFYANEYCLFCLGLGVTQCSCTDADGAMPDGTDCSVTPDCEDSYMQSRCQSGFCAVE